LLPLFGLTPAGGVPLGRSPFFFDNRPGLAELASVLFYRPERPTVGRTVEFGC